jgi:hypothetical protein
MWAWNCRRQFSVSVQAIHPHRIHAGKRPLIRLDQTWLGARGATAVGSVKYFYWERGVRCHPLMSVVLTFASHLEWAGIIPSCAWS